MDDTELNEIKVLIFPIWIKLQKVTASLFVSVWALLWQIHATLTQRHYHFALTLQKNNGKWSLVRRWHLISELIIAELCRQIGSTSPSSNKKSEAKNNLSILQEIKVD
jgi:hypothetical protein